MVLNVWRTSPPPFLSNQQRYWLTRPGALTEGLRQLGKVSIRILTESQQSSCLEDSQALGISLRSLIWAREIEMAIDGIPCVWARSITPLSAARGVWKPMRQLTTRPLATILYRDPRIIRSVFECARVRLGSQLYYSQQHHRIPQGRTPHYARRSIFYKQQQALMVSECFLPAFWRRVEKNTDVGGE